MTEPCDMDNFNDEDLDALEKAVKEISKRTSYGLRREYAEKRGTILSWSNASKRWIVTRTVDAGEEVTLDANQILVPASPIRIKRIEDCLPMLPLYELSFEAKERGEVPPKLAEVTWALKQMKRIEEEKWRRENV